MGQMAVIDWQQRAQACAYQYLFQVNTFSRLQYIRSGLNWSSSQKTDGGRGVMLFPSGNAFSNPDHKSCNTFGQQPRAMSRIEMKRANIAKQVLNTSDEDVLDQVKALLDLQSGDWWKNLPSKVRKDVEQSLAQADRGETVSHAEAMKQIRAWRKR
jgi:hypothetical protein